MKNFENFLIKISQNLHLSWRELISKISLLHFKDEGKRKYWITEVLKNHDTKANVFLKGNDDVEEILMKNNEWEPFEKKMVNQSEKIEELPTQMQGILFLYENENVHLILKHFEFIFKLGLHFISQSWTVNLDSSIHRSMITLLQILTHIYSNYQSRYWD